MKTIGELIDAGVISRETRVSGNIPVSADGVLLMPDAKVWPFPDVQIENDEGGTVRYVVHDDLMGDIVDDWLPDKCFSTAQAALAAKETK